VSKWQSKATAYLLVDIQFPENLGGIEEMLVLENPTWDGLVSHVKNTGNGKDTSRKDTLRSAYFFAL
jgi:hypothetical protein